MSLKLLKKSFKARPSKSSFISDFDDDPISENSFKPSHFCKGSFLHPQYPDNTIQEDHKQDECNNEINELNHIKDPQGVYLNLLKASDLGYKTLTPHSNALIDRILQIYNQKRGKQSKLTYYHETLNVFQREELGQWVFPMKQVYNTRDFQCFDVMYSSTNQAMGFMNSYTWIQTFIKDYDKGATLTKKIFQLENDCYSSINCVNSPFQNSLVLGLFSGPLLFVDVLKEKTIKGFKGLKEKQPIGVLCQKNTGFYAGDVQGNVLFYDYRVKNMIESVVFDDSNEDFKPVISLEVHNDLILAGNSKKYSVWDLRNLKNPIREEKYKENEGIKVSFRPFTTGKVMEIRKGEGIVKGLGDEMKKEDILIDFGKKKVVDMKKFNDFVLFLVDNEKESMIYCYSLEKKPKKVNFLALGKKFEHLKASEDGKLVGLMKEGEVEMISYRDKELHDVIKKKLKQIIT